MIYEAFHGRALALPGAVFAVKLRGGKRTYSVGGRLFAIAGTVGQAMPRYGFKASDLGFTLLIEQGLAQPMPYLHRAKWVQTLRHDVVGDDELMSYVAQAHGRVAAKLAVAIRAELGL